MEQRHLLMDLSRRVFLLLLIPALLTQAGGTRVSSCQSPLGLSSGGIKDNQLSSSSSFSSSSVGAENGRLGTERGGGAWCPATLVRENSSEWLQVELGREMVVTGVITQGRYAGGQGEEFAETVTIQVRDITEEAGWRTVAEEVGANTDTYSKVEILVERVRTTAVRVIPVSQHPRMVCMRIELLGCDINDLDSGDLEEEEDEVLSETEIAVTDSRDSPVLGVNIARTVLDNHNDNEIEDNINNQIDNDNHPPNKTSSDSAKPGDRVSLSSSESQYMLVSVVVLVTIIVILIITIIFILYKNHQYSRGKADVDSSQSDSARYPLYSSIERESYPASLQTTPYKYYSSPRRLVPSPGPQSHYYATTDLIHWHNTNLLSRPANNHGEQFL